MAEDNFIKRTSKNLPEGFWRFLIIGVIIYAFIIVGKVIYDNYGQNKSIDGQRAEITNLKDEIASLELNIAYYQTDTYKEKIARAKLRYALPGETVVAVPYDSVAIQAAKAASAPAVIARPNIEYWKIYFFGE